MFINLGFKIALCFIAFLILMNLIATIHNKYFIPILKPYKYQTILPIPSNLETFITTNLDNSNSSTNSNLNPKPNLQLKFISASNTSQIFNSNEYLIQMNSSNKIARQATILKYNSSIQDTTQEEKEATQNLISLINFQASTKPKLKSFLNHCYNLITIAKSQDWLENGMPHTHKQTVILPQSWFNEILNTTTRTNTQRISSNGGTLIHEITHILQRVYPDKFKNLYTKHWGFKNIEYIDNFENIKARNRANPDGMDVLWIWISPYNKLNQAFWIGAVFNSYNPKALNDVEYLAYPVYEIIKDKHYKLGEQEPLPLQTFNEFQNFFNLTINNYHPNEIVAEYMNVWFHEELNLSYSQPETKQSDAYLRFKKWLETSFL